ncbi:MAG TPA: hypothetical protein PLY70_07740, partial [Saprospiraceae bacterium]|nr:hypothetical protein [Saprospiraceae bacterium]
MNIKKTPIKKSYITLFSLLGAAIISGIVSLVNGCFDRRSNNEKLVSDTAKISQSLIDLDSSTINNINQSQNNSFNGSATVTNEYVYGDKTVIQNNSPKNLNSEKNRLIESTKTEDQKIENNGNLSIGQSGGTVNQTTIFYKPQPRHLTVEMSKDILDKIPEGSKVFVTYPMNSNEAEVFTKEIIKLLFNNGHKVEYTTYIMNEDLEQDKWY